VEGRIRHCMSRQAWREIDGSGAAVGLQLIRAAQAASTEVISVRLDLSTRRTHGHVVQSCVRAVLISN